jgi:sec-independent protein translocase protein TatB
VFDIGFLELLLIFVVALLVLGPEKLPYVARTIGLWIGKIKRSIAGVQMEVERELRFEEMRREAEERAKQLEKEMALPELSIDPSHPSGSHDFEPLPRDANSSVVSTQGDLAEAADNATETNPTKSTATKTTDTPHTEPESKLTPALAKAQDNTSQGQSDAN